MRAAIILLAAIGILFAELRAPQIQSKPHGIFALYFPGTPTNKDQYIMPNVTGSVAFAVWNVCEKSAGIYDWSCVEPQIEKWWAAGKQTAIVIWGVADGPNSPPATPSYVLATLPPTVSCTDASNVPDFQSPNYYQPFRVFSAALFSKYGNDPRVAYIRVPGGGGGENYANCTTQQESAYGITQASWTSYIMSGIDFTSTIAGSVPVDVALDCWTPCQGASYQFPDAIEQEAAKFGFGLGTNGLQKSDASNYSLGMPCSGGDWCKHFLAMPAGSLLEVQAAQPTCPDNSCTAGADSVFLPFAQSLGATVYEANIGADLCPAYCPPPGPYAAAYQQTFSAFMAGGFTLAPPTGVQVVIQ